MRQVSIIGSTGSIGRQSLDIIESQPENFKLCALAAGSKNLGLLAEQIGGFHPALVAVPNEEDRRTLQELLKENKYSGKTEIQIGESGLISVAEEGEVVVTAVVGFLGVKPTLAAIRKGRTIALANKETMVAAGHLVMSLAREHKVQIVPVDSEHSAIFQSMHDSILRGRAREEVAKIILTGSGGPFRTWNKETIAAATISDALKHPNWAMGAKITIDSATLMNKGLEIIEARWLFDMPVERIEVVIHPQSILHSAVEFTDGSIVGQLGLPDMRLPIHYALAYPGRLPSSRVPRLNLIELGKLTFEAPDPDKFRCLALAREAAANDDTKACVLNAANEIAVASFLEGSVKFPEIAAIIERVLDEHKPIKRPSLEAILEADRWARNEARQVMSVSQ